MHASNGDLAIVFAPAALLTSHPAALINHGRVINFRPGRLINFLKFCRQPLYARFCRPAALLTSPPAGLLTHGRLLVSLEYKSEGRRLISVCNRLMGLTSTFANEIIDFYPMIMSYKSVISLGYKSITSYESTRPS